MAVGEGESVRLKCRVEAHPIDELRFTWFFNNTLDTIEVDDQRVVVDGDHSVLDYTPGSPRDYGTLSCWATNSVGTQAEPCRFTVIEAGKSVIYYFTDNSNNLQITNSFISSYKIFETTSNTQIIG